MLCVESRDLAAQESQAINCATIERVVPPAGIEIPVETKTAWLNRIVTLETGLAELHSDTLWADVAMLIKACRYAIEFQELYSENDFKKVVRLLELATSRLDELKHRRASWTSGTGLQVRGFKSNVDGSPQPVGMIVPEAKPNAGERFPLYVWLHGRGDKATDLHFINDRLDKKGEVAPPDAIVIHPLGRQCLGYKSAGETDVMEAIDFAIANYPVDPQRVILMGFSMGGAGAWHLAAHYADRFIAVSPGAGFAETARYQNLTPERYPPKYEQTLWRVYDVPGYVRNLFNLQVVAYSGEMDKQIQAARIMEEAFQSEGRMLTHLIGPGMGHKYHPDTLKDILARMDAVARADASIPPKELILQTHAQRYATRRWIRVDGFEKQYQDTRVDARQDSSGNWSLQTRNVSRLELQVPAIEGSQSIEISLDGQPFKLGSVKKQPVRLTRTAGNWSQNSNWPELRKQPRLSGPIDDAFLDPFLVVTPTGKASHPKIEQWAQCELANFIDRWRSLFRGDPRMKRDVDVSQDDLRRYHVVVWGDPASNALLRRISESQAAARIPLSWNAESVKLGEQSWSAANHIPLMIYPNPLAPQRYVVINSGPTFRQAHDRTNSLQNPHLPDWAIVSTEEPPSASRPGKIVKTGFFRDDWQIDNELTFVAP